MYRQITGLHIVVIVTKITQTKKEEHRSDINMTKVVKTGTPSERWSIFITQSVTVIPEHALQTNRYDEGSTQFSNIPVQLKMHQTET